MNNVAIFDIDNTLVRGSTLFHLGVELKKRVFWISKNASYVLSARQIPSYSYEGNSEYVKDKTLSVIKDLPAVYLEQIIIKVVDKLFEKNIYEKNNLYN